MKSFRFTAPEIFFMAKMNGKSQIFGFPNVLSMLSAEEGNTLMQEARLSLINRGAVTMDFSGDTILTPEYRKLTEICCECSRCLTLEQQISGGETLSRIFWQKNGAVYTAEAVGDEYVFSAADIAVEGFFPHLAAGIVPSPAEPIVTVPNTVLKKAKRLTTANQTDEAFRLLRQNGADEGTSNAILRGFQGEAGYIHLRLLVINAEGSRQEEKIWLSTCGEIRSLGEATANLSSGTSFAVVSAEAANRDIQTLLAMFLNGDTGELP